MNKKNILIHLGKQRSGGGQTVALNLLQSLKNSSEQLETLIFSVPKNSQLHDFVSKDERYKYLTIPNGGIACILWEIWAGLFHFKKNNIGAVYTFFGFGMFFWSGVPQVSGAADSNLMYPELQFWHGEPIWRRPLRWVVDKYRVMGLTRADGVIFENPDLLQRAKNLYRLRSAIYLPPSVDRDSLKLKESQSSSSFISCLFLCGWHINKGIMLIPELAKAARKLDFKVKFRITAGESKDPVAKLFWQKVEESDLHEYISVVEPVSRSQLPEIYASTDFVFLLSQLESFSNTIIESWLFETPLVISDLGWSRAICQDAAIYVNRNSPESIIQRLSQFDSRSDKRKAVIDQGIQMLDKFPTIEEKTKSELSYVQSFIKV